MRDEALDDSLHTALGGRQQGKYIGWKRFSKFKCLSLSSLQKGAKLTIRWNLNFSSRILTTERRIGSTMAWTSNISRLHAKLQVGYVWCTQIVPSCSCYTLRSPASLQHRYIYYLFSESCYRHWQHLNESLERRCWKLRHTSQQQCLSPSVTFASASTVCTSPCGTADHDSILVYCGLYCSIVRPYRHCISPGVHPSEKFDDTFGNALVLVLSFCPCIPWA